MNGLSDSCNLGRGVFVRKGDKAYNRNKREQVENPLTVVGFLHSPIGVLVVLKDKNKEYSVEKVEEIEKASMYKAKKQGIIRVPEFLSLNLDMV